MSEHITNLLKLQALDFHESTEKDRESLRTELRSIIPQPILAHYDRLVARDKKGVAVVRNQVCTGCHMRLPIGTINTLMQHQDVQLCDTCGRYLVLEEPAPQTASQENDTSKKPVQSTPRPRKRKMVAPTVV